MKTNSFFAFTRKNVFLTVALIVATIVSGYIALTNYFMYNYSFIGDVLGYFIFALLSFLALLPGLVVFLAFTLEAGGQSIITLFIVAEVVYLYLLSCVILGVYAKLKKKSKLLRILVIISFCIFFLLLGFVLYYLSEPRLFLAYSR